MLKSNVKKTVNNNISDSKNERSLELSYKESSKNEVQNDYSRNNNFYEYKIGKEIIFYLEESQTGEFIDLNSIKKMKKVEKTPQKSSNNNLNISNPDIKQNEQILPSKLNDKPKVLTNKKVETKEIELKEIKSNNSDIFNFEKIKKDFENVCDNKVLNKKRKTLVKNKSLIIESSQNDNNMSPINESLDTLNPEKEKKKETNKLSIDKPEEKLKTKIDNIYDIYDETQNDLKVRRKISVKNKFTSIQTKYQEINNEGVKEFFTIVHSSINSVNIKKSENRNNFNFFRLFMDFFKKSLTEETIDFFNKNEKFMDPMFQDIYLIVKNYIVENWNIEGNDLSFISVKVYFDIITNLFSEQTLIKEINLKSNDSDSFFNENLREVLIFKSLELLRKEGNAFLNSCHKELDKFNMDVSKNVNKNLDAKFNLCLEKTRNRFLAYRNILRSLDNI